MVSRRDSASSFSSYSSWSSESSLESPPPPRHLTTNDDGLNQATLPQQPLTDIEHLQIDLDMKIQTDTEKKFVENVNGEPAHPHDNHLDSVSISTSDGESQLSSKQQNKSGAYGWVVVAAAFFSNICVDGIVFTIGKILSKPWKAEFKSSETEVSVCISMLYGSYLLVGPLASGLSNRYGCRTMTIVGSIIAACGFLLSILAPTIQVLYLTFGLVVGIGFGFVYLPGFVMVATYFDTRRALATGIAVCGSGIGTGIFAYLNPLVFTLVGNDYQVFLIYIAMVALLCVIPGMCYRPLSPGTEGTANTPVTKVELPVPDEPKGWKADLFVAVKSILDKELLVRPSFWIMAVAGFMTMSCTFLPYTYLHNFIEKCGKENDAKLPVTLLGIFSIVARLVCGYIADHPRVDAILVSSIAVTAAGLATMAVPLLRAYWLFLAFSVPFATGVSFFIALRTVICVELFTIEKLPSAFGIVLMFMGGGALVGSPIAAYLQDLSGNFNLSFYVMGGVMAVSGIMCLPLRRLARMENRGKKNNDGEDNGV